MMESNPAAEARFQETVIDVATLSNALYRSVVLDCRFSLAEPGAGEKLYQQDHIPGAFYCHLERDLSAHPGLGQAHGGRHPLPSLAQFAHTLQLAGIRRATSVVVYDDQGCAFAARAWWLLKAAGVEDVKVLNGGYRAWRAAHKPLDRRRTQPVRASSPPIPTAPFAGTLDYQALRQSQENAALTLIDSREPQRFRGEQEPIDPVAGHIPGALNKPWTEITDEQGFLQPPDFHVQRWRSLDSSQPPVVYCGSGVTACVNLLSLHLAGREGLLYPGSWSDWCSYADAPVATGD